MAYSYTEKKRIRKDFSKLPDVMDVPYLLAIQLDSYREFLQAGATKDQFRDVGLHAAFKSVFPIISYSGNAALEYVGYRLGEPAFDVKECVLRGVTVAVPLRVKVRLIIFDKESSNKAIKDIKEQEVYMGEIPLMTENGTFIINGTERVVVSQLHRSPGVFFDHDKGKTHSSGKLLYSARVIPYRGSWLDFEFDHKDILYVRIDRRRKLYATVLLRALGYSTEELLNYFYDTEVIHFEPSKKYSRQVNYELLVGQRATRDIKHPKTKEVLVKKNRKFTKGAIRKLQESGVDLLPIDIDELVGKVSAKDVIDESTGEVLLQCNEELSEAKLDELRDRGVEKVEVLFIDNLNVGPYLRTTLLADKLQGQLVSQADAARPEIESRVREGLQPLREALVGAAEGEADEGYGQRYGKPGGEEEGKDERPEDGLGLTNELAIAGEGELAHEVADVEGVAGGIEAAIDRDGFAGRDAFAESVEVGAVGQQAAPLEIFDKHHGRTGE